MQKLVRVLGAGLLLSIMLFFAVMTAAVAKGTWFGSEVSSGTDRVAVLEVKGVIYKSLAFTSHLEEIAKDPHVKALVVRINSPGGLVGPSQEIYEALKKLDQKIPVVISMGALAASGGYYAALGGRKVYANAGTLTGSIGVIMEFMNLERLYDWARVERFALKSGKLKDIGSESRKMTPDERDFLNHLLGDIHSQFKAAVQERRKLSDADMEKYTDGRILSGAQAKEANLVDALGGFEDALKDAKAIAGLPEDAPVQTPDEGHRGLLKELLQGSDEQDSWGSFFQAGINVLRGQPEASTGWRVMLLAPVR